MAERKRVAKPKDSDSESDSDDEQHTYENPKGNGAGPALVPQQRRGKEAEAVGTAPQQRRGKEAEAVGAAPQRHHKEAEAAPQQRHHREKESTSSAAPQHRVRSSKRYDSSALSMDSSTSLFDMPRKSRKESSKPTSTSEGNYRISTQEEYEALELEDGDHVHLIGEYDRLSLQPGVVYSGDDAVIHEAECVSEAKERPIIQLSGIQFSGSERPALYLRNVIADISKCRLESEWTLRGGNITSSETPTATLTVDNSRLIFKDCECHLTSSMQRDQVAVIKLIGTASQGVLENSRLFLNLTDHNSRGSAVYLGDGKQQFSSSNSGCVMTASSGNKLAYVSTGRMTGQIVLRGNRMTVSAEDTKVPGSYSQFHLPDDSSCDPKILSIGNISEFYPDADGTPYWEGHCQLTSCDKHASVSSRNDDFWGLGIKKGLHLLSSGRRPGEESIRSIQDDYKVSNTDRVLSIPAISKSVAISLPPIIHSRLAIEIINSSKMSHKIRAAVNNLVGEVQEWTLNAGQHVMLVPSLLSNKWKIVQP